MALKHVIKNSRLMQSYLSLQCRLEERMPPILQRANKESVSLKPRQRKELTRLHLRNNPSEAMSLL